MQNIKQPQAELAFPFKPEGWGVVGVGSVLMFLLQKDEIENVLTHLRHAGSLLRKTTIQNEEKESNYICTMYHINSIVSFRGNDLKPL